MRNGSICLSDVAARATHIELACTRCERRGRYRLEGLIRQFGPDLGIPDLAEQIAPCPNRNSSNFNVRCDVFYPGLGALMRGEKEE
ncbi:hypothetical protein J2793_004179 [Paraburkholderia caledonica]|uniref:Uncharacterized protein n=1 Tax=Paraburkholderia caledonica TaxID=134536 RepID=A0AB73IF97_9BURK|nr:hypothetical protein [Paraburkholderia caledonica]